MNLPTFSKNSLLLRGLLLLVFLLPLVLSAKDLTVYTYEGFSSEWGPGPGIADSYFERTGIRINYVSFGDANLIISRLRLEGKNSPADVVIGLDNSLSGQSSDLFSEHDIELPDKLKLPKKWNDKKFLPFDFGWFAFVYDSGKLKNPPQSLRELVGKSKASVIIQDARSSSPGLGLMLWMARVFREDKNTAWRLLKPRIKKITTGWTEAYSLFLRGEADMVLSYTTSPAYHLNEDGKTDYRFAKFSEGHVLQIETAGVLKNSKNKKEGLKFLEFLLSDAVQSKIPKTQWMFPVVPEELPPGFDEAKIEKTLFFGADELKFIPEWTDTWVDALGQ